MRGSLHASGGGASSSTLERRRVTEADGRASPRGRSGRYDGPAHAAPYPLTRTTPSYALVDIAAQIQKADETLAMMTGGKLGVIADQIAQLQQKARALLEKARRDAELHRVRCSFEKKRAGIDAASWRARNAHRAGIDDVTFTKHSR